MAEGGTLKARRERAEAASAALNEKFQKEGLPSPKQVYRMGEEEFAFNVTQRAMIKSLEALGMDQDLWIAILHETWVEEQTLVYEWAKKQKSEMIRKQLTDGIVIRPNLET